MEPAAHPAAGATQPLAARSAASGETRDSQARPAETAPPSAIIAPAMQATTTMSAGGAPPADAPAESAASAPDVCVDVRGSAGASASETVGDLRVRVDGLPHADGSSAANEAPAPISVGEAEAAGTPPDTPSWKLDIDAFARARVEEPSHTASGRRSKKGVRKFYEQQNELIEKFQEADARAKARASGVSPGRIATDADEHSLAVKIAINGSFAMNVVLFVIKIVAATASGSIAVIASVIDSSLDLLSGSIIFFAARAAAKANPYKYPVGKTRLEPLAIIVFAAVMGVAALQLVVESIQILAKGVSEGGVSINVDNLTIGVLAAVIGVKLVLLVVCLRLGAVSPSVMALAQDHRNDVVTNSLSIIAVILAGKYPVVWWLDPAAAMVLALLIVVTWSMTGREYIMQLTGKVAEPDMLSHLTFIAFNHHALIQKIDTVRAYYHGTKILVECDVVLPEEMPLKQAHDIGESLQHELEAQEYVERAFVHLDFETDHKAHDEHASPVA